MPFDRIMRAMPEDIFYDIVCAYAEDEIERNRRAADVKAQVRKDHGSWQWGCTARGSELLPVGQRP